ncbi:MAG: hypothetical protein U0264_10015 [Candidatus Kapaibacterium sp.]
MPKAEQELYAQKYDTIELFVLHNFIDKLHNSSESLPRVSRLRDALSFWGMASESIASSRCPRFLGYGFREYRVFAMPSVFGVWLPRVSLRSDALGL